MFARILVPVDGSDCSMKAVRTAGEIAAKFVSQVTLLHILHAVPGVIAAPGVVGMVVPEQLTIETIEEAGCAILQRAREQLSLPEEQVTQRSLPGHPAEAICHAAAEAHTDLIVMGSRGLSEIRAFFLGSVSDKVSHHAPCPVLIVR